MAHSTLSESVARHAAPIRPGGAFDAGTGKIFSLGQTGRLTVYATHGFVSNIPCLCVSVCLLLTRLLISIVLQIQLFEAKLSLEYSSYIM
jgi:hypothetical protein